MYCAQHGRCILHNTARSIAKGMNSGYPQIQHFPILFGQIDCPVIIQNIQFGPQHQLHPVHLPGHNMQIPEINRRTGTWNARSMFSYTQYLQSFLRSRMDHFLQAAKGMTARHGMRMYI